MQAGSPPPVADSHTRPFWAALDEGRLIVQRCDDCGNAQHYPRLACVRCHGRSLRWLEAAGTGSVYSFSVVRRSPVEFSALVPYVVAVVELDEGPRLATRIVTDDPDAVAIGRRVRIDFAAGADADGRTLPLFRTETDAAC